MAEEKEQQDNLNSCCNLVRRMPPSTVENSLAGLLELQPDLIDDLYTQIDTPLQVVKDTKTNREFVVCDYNRDENSYRSPWSNEYFPAMKDGFLPTPKLRRMEELANSLFDVYRKLYFEGGHSSAYFFETEDAGDNFGACWVIHKDCSKAGSIRKAWWDSTHVFEVEPGKDQSSYKLTTTVMISMVLSDDKIGIVDLSGLRTQLTTRKLSAKNEEDHVCNMGGILEEVEQRVRNAIEGIYIQKTREVVNGMRSSSQNNDLKIAQITKSLNQAMFMKKKKKTEEKKT